MKKPENKSRRLSGSARSILVYGIYNCYRHCIPVFPQCRFEIVGDEDHYRGVDSHNELVRHLGRHLLHCFCVQ